MCLAAWAIGQHPRWPWLLLSNRDEFADRPTAPLAWWQPGQGVSPVLSGRDLSAGGTWLGLNAAGRLALVTNVREPGRVEAGTPSRGELVLQALHTPHVDADWLATSAAVPRNGFNLMVAELAGVQAGWVSNRAGAPRQLGVGHHGLSNAALDTPWPKLRRLGERLQQALQASTDREALLDSAFAALADRQPAPDAQLPDTGIGLQRERQLSPAFIHIPAAAAGGRAYGTRCSTVVLAEQQGDTRLITVVERRFDADAEPAGETVLQFVPGQPRLP
jgi:uncharacterized protein with NRDE domain